MKILILSFYYEPDLCACSFRCTALVNELLLKELPDLNVEVITTLPNRYATYSADALQYEQRDNLEIHRVALPTHKSGMLDQVKAFYYFYKKALEISKNKKHDLVVATSSRLFTAFLGARISRKKGIPLYLDIRDIFIDTLKDVLSPKVSIFVLPGLKIVEKYTFTKVDKVNLVSGGFLDYFEKRYPDLTYEFFTNGIDEEFVTAQVNRVSKDKLQQKIKTILYAGNIGEGQGLHKIVPELADKLGSGFKIQIIGDGGRKLNLINALATLKVSNVELIFPVNRQELISYYNQADILFLHLNDYEAFDKVLPSKIFEYAAFNKPILAGVSGFSAKFIRQNVSNAEVFPPCDSTKAIQSLSRLSYKGEYRKEFINEYLRKNIMSKMADSILSLVKKN